MFFGEIKTFDIANGLGVRTSLFVSGCTNHCLDCFQPQTWDFTYGQKFTEKEENMILESLKPSFISGLTVLGGEPFEFANQEVLTPFLEKVKETCPEKNIWCYTGFILDQDLLEGGRRHGPYTDRMLACIDVLVDGPFERDRKDISLSFRGSSNQRIIHLPESLKQQEIVLFME